MEANRCRGGSKATRQALVSQSGAHSRFSQSFALLLRFLRKIATRRRRQSITRPEMLGGGSNQGAKPSTTYGGKLDRAGFPRSGPPRRGRLGQSGGHTPGKRPGPVLSRRRFPAHSAPPLQRSVVPASNIICLRRGAGIATGRRCFGCFG